MWASDDGREDAARIVVARKTRREVGRAVVDHERSLVLHANLPETTLLRI